MITKEHFDSLKVGSRIRSSGENFMALTNRLGTVTSKTENMIRVKWDALPGNYAYTNTRNGHACLMPYEILLDINEII